MKAIAQATIKEAVRKKTFMVMTIVSALYLILWTILLSFFQNSGVTHGMSAQQFQAVAPIMITQMGLQFSSMLLCLLTIMLGAGSIAGELETGMVHAILSRPLRRYEYVMGKFIGLLSLTLAYAMTVFVLIMLIGNAFSLSTVTSLSFIQLISGLGLYILVPAVVSCVTLYGSVSLKTVPNGLLMIFIYILGNIGGMVEMIGKLVNNKEVITSGIFLSLVSPFHTIFSAAERVLLPSSGLTGELMRGSAGLSGSGQLASVWMFVYIAVYAVGFMALAVRKFEKKDIN